MNKIKQTILWILLIPVTQVLGGLPEAELNPILSNGRILYYLSVEDEDKIEEALDTFQHLQSVEKNLKGRAMVYIGALQAVKAKHAFWPHQKVSYVNEGLETMDKGLSLNPQDIESLFVQATIYYNLPFFFGTGAQAKENFQQIIMLLPETKHLYDKQLISDIITYLLENISLSEEERQIINEIRQSI